jgi:lysophospholipase
MRNRAGKAAVVIGSAIIAVVVGYQFLDWWMYKGGTVELINCSTFPPLPLSYWNAALATERTQESAHTEIRAVMNSTAPKYFTSHFDGKTQIAYRQFLPRGAEKAAVVISSGRTENMLTYTELIGDLTMRGYSVYIHDHAGQGFSGRLLLDADDAQKSYVDDFSRYVDDLRTFVHDHVIPDIQRRGNKPLYLVAHSMGGGVASLYLEQECCRRDFTAAVLVTPMHAPKMPGWAVPGAKVMRFIHPSGYALGQGGYSTPLFTDIKSDLTHSGIRLQRIRDMYDAAAKQAATRHERDPRLGGPTHAWLSAASVAGETAVVNAHRIQVPVLILQASDDTAVDNAAQGKFCRSVPGKLCEGYVLDKAYHAVFNETDTFRVPALAKMFDFLDHARGVT